MTEADTKRIEATAGIGLPEILQALRATAGDAAVIVIPAKSGLFLTASEFRALKTTAEQVGVTVTVETNDRLRQQLAQMFSVRWRAAAVVPEPARPLSAWPARPGAAIPESEPEPLAEEPVDLSTSKPWRSEVIDVSRETALPPPPSMTPEVIDDADETPRLEALDRRRGGPLRRRGVVVVSVILVALLLSGMLGSIWLRSATVRVTLARQPVTSEVRFGVRSDGVEEVAGAAFLVDATEVRVTPTFVTTVPVTGQVTEQTSPATGALQLRNIGGEAVTIPAGTEITSRGGMRYRTVAGVDVAAGSSDDPAEGTVAIESITGGDTADAAAGTLVGALSGFEGVYFGNRDGPITGGAGQVVTGVTTADVEALVALARAELAAIAAATTVPDGGRVVPTSLLAEGEIAYTLDHAVGDATASLTINASLDYVAQAIDPAIVSAQADATLRSGLSSGVPTGFELDPASVSFGTADALPGDVEGLMRITATAEARAILDDAERTELAEDLSGRSPEDAEAAAARNPEVARIAIEVSPSWPISSLPSAGRIDVTVQ